MTVEELHDHWCREFTDGDLHVVTNPENEGPEKGPFTVEIFDSVLPAVHTRILVLSRREALMLCRELCRALEIT